MESWGQQTKRAIVLVTLALVWSRVLPAAPGKKTGESRDTMVTFSSRADLVLVPVLVTEKSGIHVAGLKKQDFKLMEDGVEQKIELFEEATTVPRRLSLAIAPHQFSNYLDEHSESTPRITAILFDLINTPFANQANARSELLKYLAQVVDPTEPTAVYTLGQRGVRVIHDFSGDPRVLAAAVRKVQGESGQLELAAEEPAAPDSSGDTEMDKFVVRDVVRRLQSIVDDAPSTIEALQRRIAIIRTLEGLQQLAQSLAGLPGRKAVIWVTAGFPFSVDGSTTSLSSVDRDSLADVQPLYERTWQRLNDAQIALYPVESGGLVPVGIADPSVSSASIARSRQSYPGKMMEQQDDRKLTFQTFAAMTGGRAYSDTNDLAKCFREAVRDSSSYYTLGYYLGHSNRKPGWRRLEVKVNHKHVSVRYRSGLRITKLTFDPELSRRDDIASAMESPLDYTGVNILLRCCVLGPGTETGKRRISYEVHLPAQSGLSLVDESDHNRVSLEFITLAKGADGTRSGQPVGQMLDTHLSGAELEDVKKNGIPYSGAVELRPGEYTLRVVVRNDLSGKVGSVSAPVTAQ